MGYKFSNELRTYGEIRAPVSAYSAVGLLGAHFKKTAPVELIRSGRLQADTETRPAFLPSEVSKNQFKKGFSGFQCDTNNPRRVGNKPKR